MKVLIQKCWVWFTNRNGS